MVRTLPKRLKIKMYHCDLVAFGIVKDRTDQHRQIKAGLLRPPEKTGGHMQAAAFWWGADLEADLERAAADTGKAA